MTWLPKNLNDSLIPFNTLCGIIGYAIFQYPIGRRRVLFSVVYATIVTSIYWVLFAFTLKYSFESTWFKREEKVMYFLVYVNFVTATLSQLFSCYYNEKFSCFVHRITKVDETLHELGVPFDYSKCMHFGIRIVVYWLIMVIFQNSIDALWFLDELPLGETIIVILILHHPFHINTIVNLKFALFVRILEMRFSKVNKLLEDTLKPALKNQQFMNDCSCWGFLKNIINDCESSLSDNRTRKWDDDGKSLIQTLKHVHLEMTLLAKDLDHFYGIQILLEMAAEFVVFTGLLYNIYNIAVNSIADRRLLRTIILLSWNVIYFSKLMLINNGCERVTAEAKRTGKLVHCINNSIKDSELHDEIGQFSIQLMSSPTCFSPAGFFTLGYDFVRKISRTSAIVVTVF